MKKRDGEAVITFHGMSRKRVRQIHRWSAVCFGAAVVITIAALAIQAPVGVSYLPLPPLGALLVTGLTMLIKSQPTTGVRQIHRWSGVVFTATVLATIVALAQEEPIVWVSYLPLIPLAALLCSGIYLLLASPKPVQD